MGEGFLLIIVLALLAFIGFVIYFIFKILQFVIQAVDLYKKMVERQDTMVKILVDIRGSLFPDNEFEEKADYILKTNKNFAWSSRAAEDEIDKIPDDELMKKYNISFENEKYIYQEYKYDTLKDAVKYAKSVSK